MSVRIELLGPVRAWVDGVEVDLGPARQCAVLALLALNVGAPVSDASILDGLWEDEPPASGLAVVQQYVSRLRRVLGCGIRRWPAGYALPADGVTVDAAEFAGLLNEARSADRAGALVRAEELYAAALALWHGEAMAGLPGPAVERRRHGLIETRLAAVEDLAEVRLTRGEPGRVVADLMVLAAEYPQRERLAGALMLALYRSGRQAEALAVFRDTRRALVDGLGVEPGPGLQRLHTGMLRGDPDLLDAPARGDRRDGGGTDGDRSDSAGPSQGTRVAGLARRVPAQLPADVSVFTGRRAELAELDRLLAGVAGESTAVVVSAVAGTAGVGKTALAVHWAHRVAERFGDGQLYVNLRGYDAEQPLPAGDALGQFLAALGVPGREIPLDLEERAARYRSELAGRRMLIVLDNAASTEQVRPLLPGSPGCAVLVTSRDSLAGLVAMHGAGRLDLDLLPAADAHALLGRLIGARAEAEPEAVAALAERCARLPLALRVAAELAGARPGAALAGLVVELADRQRRLDLLDAGGDPRAAVRGVFSWSYDHLPAAAGRMFRLLGLHPGLDFDAYAAAALAGADLPDAQRAIDLLARAHLVQPTGAGRYGMHDLLRGYASQVAVLTDSEQQRYDAADGLLRYYVATAAAAADALYPWEAHHRPRIDPPSGPVPPVAEESAARAWLDAERPNLVAAAAHGSRHGWPGHTIRLSAVLFRHLDTGAHYLDALAIHSDALHAARQIGDGAAQAAALCCLAGAHFRLGRHDTATEQLRQARALAHEAGDRLDEARALGNMSLIDLQLGRYESSNDASRLAMALYQQIGDRLGEARAISRQGDVYLRWGRYELATEHIHRALALVRDIGSRMLEGNILDSLGQCYTEMGRYQPAAECLRQALEIHRQVADQVGITDTLANLGDLYIRLGRLDQAVEHLQQSLTLARETGYRQGESRALNGLGDAAQVIGEPAEALSRYTAALAVATEIGARDRQAHAHAGIARTLHGGGDHSGARGHYQAALAHYTELGTRDAEEIAAHLAALDQP